MFKSGSIMSLATCHLLENHDTMMAMMGHHTCTHIYGVVDFDWYQTSNMYSVTWLIYGLFNMSDDKVSEINPESKYFWYLNLVRKNDDANKGDDAYVKQYFQHDDTKWKLRNIAITCDICNCNKWFFESRRETQCRRSHIQIHLPMLQLYFDLELEINEYMSMAQKRHTCYKFYTKVVHGVLTVGDRRRVCSCVDDEIGRKFPR